MGQRLIVARRVFETKMFFIASLLGNEIKYRIALSVGILQLIFSPIGHSHEKVSNVHSTDLMILTIARWRRGAMLNYCGDHR